MQPTLHFLWTDGTHPAFAAFSQCLEDYFNALVGGCANRKEFIRFNARYDIHDVLLAYDGETPVACASYKAHDSHTAEVKRVFVREDYRGQGISRLLMAQLEQRAVTQGYTTLILQTREACREAVGLYRAIGYRQIPNYPPYDTMPIAVCFAKALR